MNGEVLITSTLRGCHILGILHVALQRLGNAAPFDELLNRHIPSVKVLDRVLKTNEYRLWRLGRIELSRDTTTEPPQ